MDGTRLDDRGPGSGEPVEPLPERPLRERALRAGPLERGQRVADGGEVGAGGERAEPVLVELDPGREVAEPLGVDDHADVDRLASLDAGHDPDEGVLEGLWLGAHIRITSGTIGARLASSSM